MYTKYEQTAHYIQQFITEGTPEFAIILGSGLSSLQAEGMVTSLYMVL